MTELKQLSVMYWDKAKEVFVGGFEVDGLLSPYVVLDGPRARNMAGYYAIRQDLMEADNSIKFLIDHSDSDPVVQKGLLFAAVIQYAKAYTSNTKRWAQLNADKVFKSQHSEALDFHRATMEMRHAYLAHAGESAHESRVLVAYLNPDESSKDIKGVLYNSVKLMNDNTNLSKYLAMIGIAIGYVEAKIKEIKAGVDKEIDAMSIDDLYDQAVTPHDDNRYDIPNLT